MMGITGDFADAMLKIQAGDDTMTDLPDGYIGAQVPIENELLDALEKCERAIDGSLRGAGQSVAGFLAGRRQMSDALVAARAAIAKARNEAKGE